MLRATPGQAPAPALALELFKQPRPVAPLCLQGQAAAPSLPLLFQQQLQQQQPRQQQEQQ